MPGHELKAQTQLRVSGSRLRASDLISLLKQAAQNFNVPVLSKPQKLQILNSSATSIEFAITVVPRRAPLATFTAAATDQADGGFVRLGGLDQYRTTQSAVLGLIPVGPKSVPAFGLYKRFVEDVEKAVSARDPSAKITRIP